MRVVFFGTPEFAVPSLQVLLQSGFDVVGVVTQPDRPRGRSRSVLIPPPVKTHALAAGLPVVQPPRPRTDDFVDQLRAWKPDVGVVVAYGHILIADVLQIPQHGMINVHASLLPMYRGAAPVQHAIKDGCAQTGVSIMQMDEGMDTGPVAARVATSIQAGETSGELLARLATLGGDALVDTLQKIDAGTAMFEPQDHARASLAPKVTRETARIDWNQPAATIVNLVRAMDPAPGAWCEINSKPVKFFAAESLESGHDSAPGTVLPFPDVLTVAAGQYAVRFKQVQPAGKQKIPSGDWMRGNGPSPGDRFG